ncbi:hypothetical protein QQ045_031000 [Rhodiola kirilowii]
MSTGYGLRKLFDSSGIIMDVFIPSKAQRVSNSRFGFVRFKEMEEAQTAISKWNGLVFGRCRLVVKLADCGGKPRFLMSVSEEGQHWGFSETRRGPNLFKGVDVVTSKEANVQISAKKRLVSLEVIPENEEWLLRSAVAELLVFISPIQLEEELKIDGIKFHKIFPFGGKKFNKVQYSSIKFNTFNEVQ